MLHAGSGGRQGQPCPDAAPDPKAHSSPERLPMSFQCIRAKFLWICSLTEPRMSLFKAISPEILGKARDKAGPWPRDSSRGGTHHRCCKACCR